MGDMIRVEQNLGSAGKPQEGGYPVVETWVPVETSTVPGNIEPLRIKKSVLKQETPIDQRDPIEGNATKTQQQEWDGRGFPLPLNGENTGTPAHIVSDKSQGLPPV